jgi:hypothetical protein
MAATYPGITCLFSIRKKGKAKDKRQISSKSASFEMLSKTFYPVILLTFSRPYGLITTPSYKKYGELFYLGVLLSWIKPGVC